jgi:hypothetical protein
MADLDPIGATPDAGVGIDALLREIDQLEKLGSTSFCTKLTYLSKAAAVKCRGLLRGGYWLDVDFIPTNDVHGFKAAMLIDVPELTEDIFDHLLQYHMEKATFVVPEEHKQHYQSIEMAKQEAHNFVLFGDDEEDEDEASSICPFKMPDVSSEGGLSDAPKQSIPELREAEPLVVEKRKAASQAADSSSAGGSSPPKKAGRKQPYDARVGPDGSPHEMLYEQDEINFKHDPREEANTKAAAEQQTAFNAAIEGE